MAWNEGNLTNAAGAIISILDTYLVANSYWSVHDASAGTNAKVYRNNKAGENSDFYVYVGDNQVDYTQFVLWEGWDAGTHTGSGDSITGYLKKSTGGWGMSVLDLRFIFVNKQDGHAIYIGQTRRHDTTKDMPIIIAGADDIPNYNPLGSTPKSTEVLMRALRDKEGIERDIWLFGIDGDSVSAAYTRKYNRTTNGKFWLLEDPVIETNNYEQLGFLEGACCPCYNRDNKLGLTNGDIVTDDNNVEWLVVQDSSTYFFTCIVRKN